MMNSAMRILYQRLHWNVDLNLDPVAAQIYCLQMDGLQFYQARLQVDCASHNGSSSTLMFASLEERVRQTLCLIINFDFCDYFRIL